MSEGKGLSSFTCRISYDPAVPGHDIQQELFLPCLALSRRYDRASAYFSSLSLHSYAEGLHAFVENGGRIRFVFSNRIAPEEMEGILESYRDREEKIAKDIEIHFDELKNDYEIANLGYLIRHGIAEVKIAFMMNDKAESLFHQKFGIFTDEEGYSVGFQGSANETLLGSRYNSELTDVYLEKTDPLRVEDLRQRFEQIWNGTYSPYVRVFAPTDRLFQVLRSFDRGRSFSSKQDFREFRRAQELLQVVYLDAEVRERMLLVDDFAHHPSCVRALSGFLSNGKGEREGDWGYRFSNFNPALVRQVQKALERWNVPFRLSDRLAKLLAETDQLMEQRLKLALKIKKWEDIDLWKEDYDRFSEVVSRSLLLPLKEFQMRAAYFHYRLLCSADYSVPGSGKTYIAYGLYAYLRATGQADSLLVFAPLNAFLAWREEGEKLFGKGVLSFYDVSQCPFEDRLVLKRQRFDVCLFNYEFFNSEEKTEEVHSLLSDKTLLVFDEIHRIKGTEGVRASWIKKLVSGYPSPKFRLALTGTPLPNSFLDMKNTLEILYANDPEMLSRLLAGNLSSADTDELFARQVRERLYPTFVRVTKKELGIPPAEKDDLATLAVDPDEGQRRIFEEIWKQARNPLLAFVRLIQASSNLSLLSQRVDPFLWKEAFDDQPFPVDDIRLSPQSLRYAKEHPLSSKTIRALEFVEGEAKKGRKVLLWCLFLDTIAKVVSSLRERGISALSITGADSEEDRVRKIRLFRDGECMVLVTNPNTLAESVSLHRSCHEAVYLEYGFNLTYLLQSKDRIHRVGLPEGTRTHYFFAITESAASRGGSIDRRIIERLERKNERMVRTIESNDLVVDVDREDLRKSIEEILGR